MKCPLCASDTIVFSEIQTRIYYRCIACKGIALDPSQFLSHEAEKKRYQLHDNNINDSGYQKFVSPIIRAVIKEYESNHQGLDFGSGSGPVITSQLRKKGYSVVTYDPFFDANHSVLKKNYNYIICCEVMEHFYNPAKEFKLLSSLLHSGGTLYCKTRLFSDAIDFNSWWYKNDPTHVFFYTEDTLHWIKENFGFESMKIKDDLIVFRK